MDLEDSQYICQVCAWEQVPYARARRCIAEEVLITCPKCGEIAARKQTHCECPCVMCLIRAVSRDQLLLCSYP